MSVAPSQKTHPGRWATPLDTKKEPEQRLLDKETCHIYPSSNFVNFDIPEGLITVLECS